MIETFQMLEFWFGVVLGALLCEAVIKGAKLIFEDRVDEITD